MKSIPLEIDEAAALDGCSPLGTFWRVILPLLRPVTATVSILVSISVWNDLAIPLLFLPSGRNTVTEGTYDFISSVIGKGFVTSEVFPAAVLAVAPLFITFLLLQRHIIAGITAGVGKG